MAVGLSDIFHIRDLTVPADAACPPNIRVLFGLSSHIQQVDPDTDMTVICI